MSWGYFNMPSWNYHAADIRAKAEETLERERKSAVNEIKNEISDMVILAASKVAEKEISAKDNEELITRFLSEMETAR